MKIVFMGTPRFSVKILESVHEKYGVDLVVTQPDKLVGRKKVLTFSPVKEKAVELGIRVFQPRKMKENFQEILDVKPDIIITAAYGQIIPDEVLFFPRLGSINVHGSLLPLLRGGAPIQRSIMRLHNTTGITIMYMATKMDSGDIISQRSIPIMDNDTTGTLFEKLSYVGEELLMETLPSIIEGTNRRVPQDPNLITYAYNLKREEEKADFNKSVEEVDAHLRAFDPAPGIYTELEGKQIKIWKADIHKCSNFEKHHSLDENGTIIKIFEDAIGVKCSNGVFKIKELQLSGKTRQDVKTFMMGAGRNLIATGKVFK